MVNLLIIFLGIILLVLLLHYEKKEKLILALGTKTVLSSLFFMAAIVQPHSSAGYYPYLLGGLIFCLVGDVCLALRGEKMFTTGLIAFLLGHILYILGFQSLIAIREWIVPGSYVIWGISLFIFFWLRPRLGAMTLPVAIYIVVITVMTMGALAVFLKTGPSLWGRMLILSGAVLFYFSDVLVARDKFIKREFLNRQIGLPLYYVGQFLLAFSVGLMK